jgi:hypothetical protein
MVYTNYLVYQGADGFIRGASISWEAENSTIAPAPEGGPGNFCLDYLRPRQPWFIPILLAQWLRETGSHAIKCAFLFVL